MFKKLFASVALAALLPVQAQVTSADNYPDRPIKIVVPFSAGGGGDTIVRSWSQELSETLKQPVIIDNKGGGGTVIGTQNVASSAPDGYTVLFVSQAIAVNPFIRDKMPYQTPESFAPVAKLITYAMGFAATADRPYNNVQELVAYAKKNPGKLSIATSGEGSATDIAAGQFMLATGTELTKVPFKGAGEAAASVASGHVDLIFTGMSQLKPLLDGKRIKLIATSGEQRMKSAPAVPTIAEQGYPGFNAVVWWGMLAPAGTPPAVINKLNQALRASLSKPAVSKRLEVIDGVVQVSTPAEFESFIKSEMAIYQKLLAKPAKSN